MLIGLIENTGKDFYHSRLRFAKFLQNKGNRIFVIVPNDGYYELIKNEGFEVLLVCSNIRGSGIKNKIKFAYNLFSIIRTTRFDIIHCFRLQPNIIGAFIGGILGNKRVFNHVTGLGSVFVGNTIKYRFLQYIVRSCYQINSLLFRTKFIFQNEEDAKDLGIKSRYRIVPGSAVDEDLFYPGIPAKQLLDDISINNNSKIILFVGRLVRSKGLSELVQAINLANKNFQIKFTLLIAGWVDKENPDCLIEEELNSIISNEFVNYLGERRDINLLISISDICVLPTFYREGTPRFLLEAMACAKPIITTDMPGCNHLIKAQSNGIIVKPKNAVEIAEALKHILANNPLEMGIRSRTIYQNNFSEDIIYNGIYNYYLDFLN